MINDAIKKYTIGEPNTSSKTCLFLVLSLFLFAMHIPIVNLGGEGLNLPFNATSWIALGFIFSLALYRMATKAQLIYTPFTIAFLLCCLFLTAPVFYPGAIWQASLQRLVGLWGGLFFFISLQQFDFKNKIQLVLWSILLATLIEAGFGYYQFLFLSTGDIFGFITNDLPFGVFQNASAMASFLVTGFAISGYLLPLQNVALARAITLCTPLFIFPLVIILASHAAWLSCTISLILLIPYLYNTLEIKYFFRWIAIILFAVVATLALGTIKEPTTKPTAVIPHAEILYPHAIDMLLEKPWQGVGYGNFEYSYMHFTAARHAKDPDYLAGVSPAKHPQNEGAYWVIEGGVLPLIGIFLLVGATFLQVYRYKKVVRLGMLAMLLPLLIQAQVNSPFYLSYIHWLCLVILFWWLDRQNPRYYSSLGFSLRSICRLNALVAPLLITGFMLLVLQANHLLVQFEKEQSGNLTILDKIMMPAVLQDRVNEKTYTSYLSYGKSARQPRLIKLYINWATEQIKRQPRVELYLGLIDAYRALGDDKNVRLITSDAKYLFPDDPHFT